MYLELGLLGGVDGRGAAYMAGIALMQSVKL